VNANSENESIHELVKYISAFIGKDRRIPRKSYVSIVVKIIVVPSPIDNMSLLLRIPEDPGSNLCPET
jgi:hypothetical protein